MGGFACSVILPLWWLLNPTELGTYISIVTGSLVVLSLVLLFLDLKKRMNIKWAIDYLKEKAMEEVDEEPDLKRKVNRPAEKKITAIDNIAMGAYGDHNYEIFRLAEMALTRFAWKLEDKCKKLKEESTQKALHAFVFRMLLGTCEETIDNPRAPIITIRHLGKTGAKAIEEWRKSSDIPKDAPHEDMPQTTKEAIHIIMAISEECEKKSQDRLDPLIFTCVVALGGMFKAVNELNRCRDWVAGKIKGVLRRFKNKDEKRLESWYNKAKKIISDLDITL